MIETVGEEDSVCEDVRVEGQSLGRDNPLLHYPVIQSFISVCYCFLNFLVLRLSS